MRDPARDGGIVVERFTENVDVMPTLAELIGEPIGAVVDVHEKVLITGPQGMVQGGEGDSASFDIPASPGVTGVVVLLTVTFAIGD